MNIEEHKFKDEDIDHVNTLKYNKGIGIVEINFCNGNALHLFKADVIALAKHFDLLKEQ